MIQIKTLFASSLAQIQFSPEVTTVQQISYAKTHVTWMSPAADNYVKKMVEILSPAADKYVKKMVEIAKQIHIEVEEK